MVGKWFLDSVARLKFGSLLFFQEFVWWILCIYSVLWWRVPVLTCLFSGKDKASPLLSVCSPTSSFDASFLRTVAFPFYPSKGFLPSWAFLMLSSIKNICLLCVLGLFDYWAAEKEPGNVWANWDRGVCLRTTGREHFGCPVKEAGLCRCHGRGK